MMKRDFSVKTMLAPQPRAEAFALVIYVHGLTDGRVGVTTCVFLRNDPTSDGIAVDNYTAASHMRGGI